MTTTKNYSYVGLYDKNIFIIEFENQFGKNPHYRKSMQSDLTQVLEFIGKDITVTDVRWAAYMLATTLWETTTLRSEEITVKGKKKKIKSWVYTMSPVEEVGHGKGRKYHEPVKVKQLPTGSVRVTEHDGDQFEVNSSGRISKLSKGAKLGAKDGGSESSVYTKDDGVEGYYFGRGYVQLTWWSNYAQASIALGKNFDLLLKPDLVLEPDIAYKLMSYGMCTGKLFANGHSFSDYFGSLTDYKGARAMVNGIDHADDIAAIAKKFESILINSKVTNK
ncbi:MAG: hypothetical protein WCI11_13285 [Candidatus Methylumidiphilus sp.]